MLRKGTALSTLRRVRGQDAEGYKRGRIPMPKFLETKLKKEYGEKSAVPFKVMNAIGAMRGSKETAKGRAMEEKHEAKMKTEAPMPMSSMRIEVHHGPKMKVTGHTVHHEMMPKPSKGSMAFSENTSHSFPFDANGKSSSHGDMMDHIAEHLGMDGSGGKAEAEDEGGE
jgi:hypothetical protein